MRQSAIFIVFCLIIFTDMVSAQSGIKLIRKNIKSYYVTQERDTAELKKWLNNLSADGKWKDIDYEKSQIADWPAFEHPKRLLALSSEWSQPDSDFRNDSITKQIVTAFNHWIDHDYQNPNWWFNQIGVPQYIGPVAILMDEAMAVDSKPRVLKIMARSKIGMTGQNKVSLALNNLYRAVIQSDTALLFLAVKAATRELSIKSGEGIQADYSFHQNGPQQQFGSYGLNFGTEMIKLVYFLRGSSYEINKQKLSLLENYFQRGLCWVSYKGKFDISACGRQLLPNSPAQKGLVFEQLMNQLAVLDTTYNLDFTPEGTNYFWRSDYMVHHSDDFAASVKMSSKRVVGSEAGNGENLQGYHLADGAMYTYRSGKEYENIFPYWNWSKLPGTTTYLDTAKLPVLTWKGYRNQSDFVGGVSDSTIGIASMEFYRNGLGATKSWFMFDDGIVCVGSGIEADINLPVTTTINQCLLNGPIIAADNEYVRSMGRGEHFFENLQWLIHDSIGYYFFYNQQVVLEVGNKKGSWANVADYLPKDTTDAKLFSLNIEHGEKPFNGNYAYAIIPNVNRKKMESYYRYQLLENTVNIHAVRDSRKETYSMVFFKAGGMMLSNELGIGVNRPSMIIAKPFAGGVDLSISEPTCLQDSLEITLIGLYETRPGIRSEMDEKNQETTVFLAMPNGEMRGSTLDVSLVQRKSAYHKQ